MFFFCLLKKWSCWVVWNNHVLCGCGLCLKIRIAQSSQTLGCLCADCSWPRSLWDPSNSRYSLILCVGPTQAALGRQKSEWKTCWKHEEIRETKTEWWNSGIKLTARCWEHSSELARSANAALEYTPTFWAAESCHINGLRSEMIAVRSIERCILLEEWTFCPGAGGLFFSSCASCCYLAAPCPLLSEVSRSFIAGLRTVLCPFSAWRQDGCFPAYLQLPATAFVCHQVKK